MAKPHVTGTTHELPFEKLSPRTFEQYDQVDARNRLVAAELESRWNVKLEQQARLRRAIAELEAQDQPLGPEDERTIRALGENFARVWNDKSCPIELKKKIGDRRGRRRAARRDDALRHPLEGRGAYAAEGAHAPAQLVFEDS